MNSPENTTESIEGYPFNKIDRALGVMIATATELGLDKGVAFVAIRYLPDGDIAINVRVLDLERAPRPEVSDDTGTNYFGVAMSKLAEMLSLDIDSGSGLRPPKLGETGYRGGVVVCRDSTTGKGVVFTGFSGGSQEQDVRVGRVGGADLISNQ